MCLGTMLVQPYLSPEIPRWERGWVGIVQAAKHAQANLEFGISWERDAQLQPFQVQVISRQGGAGLGTG